jgi:hypothetical protein
MTMAEVLIMKEEVAGSDEELDVDDDVDDDEDGDDDGVIDDADDACARIALFVDDAAGLHAEH